jgi:hypothetical protein
MARLQARSSDPSFLNLSHAGWVARVLGMLIAVVGRESLLGLILGQARCEIASVLRDTRAEPATNAPAFESN